MAVHCMIDLETMSTQPDATVLTLGAVKFDPTSSELLDELYLRINIEDQDALGRHVDDDTLAWWSRQDPVVLEEAFCETDRVPLIDAISKFHKFAQGCSAFWSHGATFDLIIINHIYTQLNRVPPWNYWQMRDTRTLFDLGIDPAMTKEGLHNALEDAKRQAVGVQTVYASLREAGISK